ncbi:MAG: leucine-rich repeat domain-containing protein, partial [Bacteroidales bacterium]|nr:leucine-rich repeat domain-containing protein [Candidatus Sodaliphilus aphodohippi]
MKKILIIAIALLACFTASAYDYMIDGIAYNLNSDGKSLSVTFTTANMREANYPGLTSPIIPDSVTIDGNAMPVTAIGFHAFERTHFEAVTFPKTPVEIGEYAFYWSCLTSITLPEGLAKLGTGAFSSCYYLKSVHLPSSLSEFGTGAFLNCPGLASVTYSDGLSTIPSATFCLCTGLTSLEFKYPISVASSAFAECTGIKKVRVAADCEFDPNWITGVQIDTLE